MYICGTGNLLKASSEDKSIILDDKKHLQTDKDKLLWKDEDSAPKIPKSETQSTFNPDLEKKSIAPEIPKSETQSTFNPELEIKKSEPESSELDDSGFIKNLMDWLSNND